MSLTIMVRVLWTDFKTLKATGREGKEYSVSPTSAKIVLLSLADRADDFGENSFNSVETIAKKSSLDPRSVRRVLRALEQNGYCEYKGLSKYGTSNYSILPELLGNPPEKREKAGRPKADELKTPDSTSQTPDSTSSDPSLTVLNKNMGANAPASSERRTDAKVRGDMFDGILAGERLRQERAEQEGIPVEVLSAVMNFPTDCQQVARLIYDKFKMIPPAKPRSSKGGDYAFWITGIREINQTISRYKVDTITAFNTLYKRWNESPFEKKSPKSFVGPLVSVLSTLAVREASNQPTPEPEPSHNPVPRPDNLVAPRIALPPRARRPLQTT